MATKVFVGLGSNLGDSRTTVRCAARALASLGYGVALSPLYRTVPQSIALQPPYINAVAAFYTAWPPDTLLTLLLHIEARFGRFRRARGESRTLDLDLLLYGDAQVAANGLMIPHPRILERRFVLEPLWALEPDLILPGGIPVAQALLRTARQGVVVDAMD
ncbi:MAG: 2-amino-4-hydroxy-6-hydroxymethyldihydropteridine diphosphokinase [Firmicutes bacterium]|nr:2-amino-4-hydroxy-6-hydroxymethyldihydropteridine diphosphokinase [Bacillota bacterium]